MRRNVLFVTLALLALSGCVLRSAQEKTPPKGSYQIYFMATDDESGAAVSSETWNPNPGDPIIQTLLDRLLAGPNDLGLTSPFPNGVRLLQWEQEENRLHLDFSEQYEGLSGVDLTLANYCLALTLCQVEGVDSVYVTVEGAESPFLHSDELRAENVILSGAEEEPAAVMATLWFPHAEGDGLGVEYRRLLLTEEDTLSRVLLAVLLEGPTNESLRAILPPGTEILGTRLEDGVCRLDLSAAFLEGLPEDRTELRLMVYSIVNTLAGNVDAVEKVEIWVEGQPAALPGGLSGTLLPDLTLEK